VLDRMLRGCASLARGPIGKEPASCALATTCALWRSPRRQSRGRDALGYSVNYHGIGDLVAEVDAVSDADAEKLCAEYDELYAVAADLRKGGSRRKELQYAAKIELGLSAFLERGGSRASPRLSRICTA